MKPNGRPLRGWTRELIAIIALAIWAFTIWLEAHGHPLPEWAKPGVGSVPTVVFGYYFVDSARRVAEALEALNAPSPAAAAEPAAAAPEAEPAAK